jgi:hypothetical protein
MQCGIPGLCSGLSNESAVCCPWDIWCAFSGILGKHQQIFTLQSFKQFWEDKKYIKIIYIKDFFFKRKIKIDIKYFVKRFYFKLSGFSTANFFGSEIKNGPSKRIFFIV